MAKPKRTGPVKPTGQRQREKQISLRVSDAEYEAFKKTAEEMDLPLTTWIRLVCRRAAGLQTP